MPSVAAAAKWALSLGLLALIILRIDISSLPALMLEPSTLSAMLVATLGLLLQGLLAARRQMDILVLLGSRITVRASLRVWFAGLFVNQVGLTFIASDVMRGVQLVREGAPRRLAGRAVVLDRIIGLAVLLVMVDAVLPFIATLTADARLRYGLLLLALLATGGLACMLLASFMLPLLARLQAPLLRHRITEIALDLVSVARFLHGEPRRTLAISTLSLVMHLLNVAGMVLIARSLGAGASPWAMAAIMTPVMFLSMLPISIAGWGVRETAMITGLGLLQVPAQLALATSVAFGLSMLLASLPGMPVVAAARRSAAGETTMDPAADVAPRPAVGTGS
jgi:uncharacterized membrane protein YbhN (UPF0104 family)